MVELSISAEGVFGLDWPAWKRLVPAVEEMGFTGLYLCDHFVQGDPPDHPSLELMVALTYLAANSQRLRFGSMVAPLSFRDPVMLARQAAALDDLSGGRMVLGLGAGWSDREHQMFGYQLGDLDTRFARFEEGLEVISGLLRSSEPVTFAGKFFTLDNAKLPGPGGAGGPPIMIGGSGPKRTMPLVARYADVWNGQVVTPDEYRQRSALLDTLLVAEGRKPTDVRRTFNLFVVPARDESELRLRLAPYWKYGYLQHMSLDELVHELRTDWGAIVGHPDEIVTALNEYVAAGASEISIEWPGTDDIAGLELIANEIMPRLAAN